MTFQDAMNVEYSPSRVRARVLLLFGDQAELVTQERDHTNPVRVPTARLVEDTGLDAGELPGRNVLVMLGPDGEPVRFEME